MADDAIALKLITSDYLQAQKALHAKGFGTSSGKWTPLMLDLKKRFNAQSVLDYGCGQGLLTRGLSGDYREYDPAIPGKDALPEKADLVVCTDVLEHIEEDCIDGVLDHLADLSNIALLAVVHLGKAKKTLPDGRNAHILIRPKEWWIEKLSERLKLSEIVSDTEKEFGAVWLK